MKIQKIILAVTMLTIFTSVLPKIYYVPTDATEQYKTYCEPNHKVTNTTEINDFELATNYNPKDIPEINDFDCSTSCDPKDIPEINTFDGTQNVDCTENIENIYCKKDPYTDNSPTLDIFIFLDRYKLSKEKPGQFNYMTQAKRNDPIFYQFINTIIQEQAIIASSNLIRQLIYTSKEIDLHKNILEILNNKAKWLKITTFDQEFLILIPNKKYPNIKTRNDLEAIGLNNKILLELNSIDDKFYKSSEQKQQERIREISQKTPQLLSQGLIKLETLLQIFSNNPQARNLTKSVCLYGHGFVQTEKIVSDNKGQIKITKPNITAELYNDVAQLNPSQYVKFLDIMGQINCQFLYVCSCHETCWNR